MRPELVARIAGFEQNLLGQSPKQVMVESIPELGNFAGIGKARIIAAGLAGHRDSGNSSH